MAGLLPSGLFTSASCVHVCVRACVARVMQTDGVIGQDVYLSPCPD